MEFPPIMATADRRHPVPLHLPPDLDASLWSTRLDDATDPDEAVRSALVARELGHDQSEDRLLIFQTVVGLMREIEGPADDEGSWRETFRAIDAERPDRPVFHGYY